MIWCDSHMGTCAPQVGHWARTCLCAGGGVIDCHLDGCRRGSAGVEELLPLTDLRFLRRSLPESVAAPVGRLGGGVLMGEAAWFRVPSHFPLCPVLVPVQRPVLERLFPCFVFLVARRLTVSQPRWRDA